MNETINKVDILGQTRNVAFNAMWPVGVTYTQYPGQKSPEELWPTAEYGCTWEEQKYGGAFFRTEGGNAKSFGQCSVEVTTLDKLNFTFVGSDPGGWAVGDHVIADGEERTIAAAITNGFKVNETFTTSKNITNVTVLQKQATRKNGLSVWGNSQTISGGGHEHNYLFWDRVWKRGLDDITCVTNEHQATYSTTGGGEHSHTFTPSVSMGNGDSETRPFNSTYRIWKRIS